MLEGQTNITCDDSDGVTPEEKIKQILNIAPIITGSRRASKYDIPPHHPHVTEPTNGINNTNQVEVDPLALDSGKDLVDFGEADDVLGPVGLIPTTRGIASAAGQSTRPETKNKVRRARSGSGASALSARSAGSVGGKGGHDDDSDEFVDAEEA